MGERWHVTVAVRGRLVDMGSSILNASVDPGSALHTVIWGYKALTKPALYSCLPAALQKDSPGLKVEICTASVLHLCSFLLRNLEPWDRPGLHGA